MWDSDSFQEDKARIAVDIPGYGILYGGGAKPPVEVK